MSIKTLHEDSFSKIIFDDKKSLLTMIWKESTKNMTVPHFQGLLYMICGYAIQTRSKKVVHDVRKFDWRPPEYDELVGSWRTKNISPLYNKAGVEKFAFLLPPQAAISAEEEQKLPNEDFLTKRFTSESEMQKWLETR
jgi:hypothetical protein